MKGEILPIHDALIDLVLLRNEGKNASAQFTCENCNHKCTVPREGESKSSFKCCRCDVINYLSGYEVIVF